MKSLVLIAGCLATQMALGQVATTVATSPSGMLELQKTTTETTATYSLVSEQYGLDVELFELAFSGEFCRYFVGPNYGPGTTRCYKFQNTFDIQDSNFSFVGEGYDREFLVYEGNITQMRTVDGAPEEPIVFPVPKYNACASYTGEFRSIFRNLRVADADCTPISMNQVETVVLDKGAITPFEIRGLKDHYPYGNFPSRYRYSSSRVQGLYKTGDVQSTRIIEGPTLAFERIADDMITISEVSGSISNPVKKLRARISLPEKFYDLQLFTTSEISNGSPILPTLQFRLASGTFLYMAVFTPDELRHFKRGEAPRTIPFMTGPTFKNRFDFLNIQYPNN